MNRAFRDRDGHPFCIAECNTPHVRIIFDLSDASAPLGSRILSPSAAREFAKALMTVADEIEAREGITSPDETEEK
jgi:hypothetical protein